MFPLGPIMQLFQEVGRGMPGVMTKIGLGTFMDPRYDGGKLNQLTKEKGEDLVEYIPDFMGEDYLYYRSPGMNVALLRGTSADPHGNISCEKEAINLELLSVAQAVKASGGIVICQVEKLAELHEIHPRMVKVPGMYVDYVVVARNPENIPQNFDRRNNLNYNPAFTGEKVVELTQDNISLPLDHKKVIARRAAMEIHRGDHVNFGIGMPTYIPSILTETGNDDAITMISETGVIGGVPGSRPRFRMPLECRSFLRPRRTFLVFRRRQSRCGCIRPQRSGQRGKYECEPSERQNFRSRWVYGYFFHVEKSHLHGNIYRCRYPDRGEGRKDPDSAGRKV